MEKIKFPVLLTTCLFIIYVLSIQIDALYLFGATLFIALHFFLIWMVFRVLKDGQPSPKTFENQFYEDVPNEKLPVLLLPPVNRNDIATRDDF
jgi:hypothetical protein